MENTLTHCIVGNFAFLSFADFFIINFLKKKSFRNTIRMSSSLDPEQVRRFVGPDLGPNCLPRLSADDTDRQRVNQWKCNGMKMYRKGFSEIIFRDLH